MITLFDLYNQSMIGFGFLCCIFGLLFLFLKVPDNPSLKNYRLMRKGIAFAYIIVGLLQFLEFLTIDDDSHNIYMTLFFTVIVATFQACFFTFALITLIDVNFFTTKKIGREIAIILSFSFICVILLITEYTKLFQFMFYTFSAYYFSLLIRYTYLFNKHFKKYKSQMDNYFSEQESNRLHWVIFSFYFALGIGILAFFTLFVPLWVIIIIQILMIVFYFIFGIRFINYIFRFQEIEPAIVPIEESILLQEIETTDTPISYNDLEIAVNAWVQKKEFTKTGITIDKVAADMYTNRTYLSAYINSEKGKTYKAWINKLRIEEAKSIMLANPSMPIQEVGDWVGISDKSNFGRFFTRIEGCSPLVWRNNQQVKN